MKREKLSLGIGVESNEIRNRKELKWEKRDDGTQSREQSALFCSVCSAKL